MSIGPLVGPRRIVLLGAVRGITYLLLDRFTTAAAAPLTSPRTCEPGPGTLTVLDTNEIMSISGGVLAVNGTPVAGDRVVSPSTFARKAGRAFLLDSPTRTSITNVQRFGLDTDGGSGSGPTYGFQWQSATTVESRAISTVPTADVIGDGYHTLVVVMRSTGAFVLSRVGTSGDYTLLWVDPTGTAALYTKMRISSLAALDITLDNWRVTDLSSPWTDDYGIATSRVVTTGDGETGSSNADALVEHTITAATGVTQELMVRRTDDNNCWIIRMDQAGSTIKVIEKEAGVETERSSAAQTWTNNTQYRVLVRVNGAQIRTNVDSSATKNNYTSATFNQTATGTKVSHAGANLVAYPRTIALPVGV